MSVARRARAVPAVVLAAFLWGCGDGITAGPNAPTPTPAPSPSTPTPGPPEILYTLSGVVFEMTGAGRVPVEGVEVYCEPCGRPGGHSARFTDGRGAYSFDGTGGVAAGSIPMLLSKRGYVLPGQPDQAGPDGLGWMGNTSVQVSGDTRFDIQIVRK